MITYYKSAFSLNLLLRVNGSAIYRAFIPGIISVVIYLAVAYTTDRSHPDDTTHPYSIGVLVTSVTFLIVFRANQGYSRYWEACGNVHHMMSKWLDATTHTGCYHMQCDHYKHIKPPSYFEYPELNRDYLTRERERASASLSSSGDMRTVAKSINVITKKYVAKQQGSRKLGLTPSSRELNDDEPVPLVGHGGLDGGWGELFNDGTATYYNKHEDYKLDKRGFASTKGGRTPALFLQELAHLSSLMNAVALSTLRNDVEGAESPLDVYDPGAPWPQVDPSKGTPITTSFLGTVRNFLGADRSPLNRTKYNAQHPLAVLGGVSDSEIRFLQMAKGPSAKTQLCWNWLSEFIIREHLAGSTGKVGPPIISRIIQFLGDGMIYYNHARKIMFIPFPFPHAQLSVFFILVMIPTVPLLMDEYTTEYWLGALLTFFTVTCLAGLHEVARELENPFRNVPNDIPLCTLQAMYNEALITMFAGYQPDAYWNPEEFKDTAPHVPKETAAVNEAPPTNGEKPQQHSEDVSKLRDIIEKQGRELERLRTLVEGKELP